MKKITLFALLFALTWQTNAQTSEISLQKRNELKLDVAYLLLSTVKVEYEYLLSDWSSMGLVASHNFSSGIIAKTFNPWRTHVLGFYRLYFGSSPTSNFFLEGGLGITSGETSSLFGLITPEKYTAFGANIAIGWKWHIEKVGISVDFIYGIGRLFHNEHPRIYPRAGICVGKRF